MNVMMEYACSNLEWGIFLILVQWFTVLCWYLSDVGSQVAVSGGMSM